MISLQTRLSLVHVQKLLVSEVEAFVLMYSTAEANLWYFAEVRLMTGHMMFAKSINRTQRTVTEH